MVSEASQVGIGQTEVVKPNLFGFHKLNVIGQEKAVAIQFVFENCLAELETIVDDGKYMREFSICKTKLEEACFFAKKSMAITRDNQE